MIKKAPNEFENFIDTLVDELISMSDDKVLEGIDSAVVQAEGVRILQAATAQAGRARLAAAKAGVSKMKARPVSASVGITSEEARQFIAKAANDGRYTLAARSLSDMPDDEAVRLYNKLKSLESSAEEGEE